MTTEPTGTRIVEISGISHDFLPVGVIPEGIYMGLVVKDEPSEFDLDGSVRVLVIELEDEKRRRLVRYLRNYLLVTERGETQLTRLYEQFGVKSANGTTLLGQRVRTYIRVQRLAGVDTEYIRNVIEHVEPAGDLPGGRVRATHELLAWCTDWSLERIQELTQTVSSLRESGTVVANEMIDRLRSALELGEKLIGWDSTGNIAEFGDWLNEPTDSWVTKETDIRFHLSQLRRRHAEGDQEDQEDQEDRTRSG